MPGRSGPSTIDQTGRELLRLGALVLLLGIAFIALLVEPTQASVPRDAERIVATAVLELPRGGPASPADDRGLIAVLSDGGAAAPAAPSEAAEGPGAPSEAAVVAPSPLVAAPAPVVFDGTRVRVARLGIDLPLLRGDTVRDTVLRATPSGAAFLLPSSAPPGSGGNSYVYAHARPGMFLALWDVRLGDLVETSAPSGDVWRYVVTEIHPRVAPTDVRYTLPTEDERITLQTSTGPNDADPRFVVVAVRRH